MQIMGIKECLGCPDAVRALRRTYNQEDYSVATLDVDYPFKPGVKGDFKTVMDVKAGCSLSGNVEGQGGTSEESLKDALANSETFVTQNCPLKAQ